MDSHKTVLITGAASGLGRALSHLFAKENYDLILVDIDEKNLSKVKSEVELFGHSGVDTKIVDLSDEDEILDLCESLENQPIDVLINNAGIMLMSTFQNAEILEWEQMSSVNLEAPFLLMDNLMPNLKKSPRPVVINIGSKSGVEIQEDRIFYTASKFALRGFSLVAAKNLAKSNILVKLYTLGSMLTNLGDESVEDRLEKQEEGKEYLDPTFVARRIFETMYNEEVEIEIMP